MLPAYVFKKWHGDLIYEVSAASVFPDEVFEWVCKVDTMQGLDFSMILASFLRWMPDLYLRYPSFPVVVG